MVATSAARADVLTQIELDNDVKRAATAALKTIPLMDGIHPADAENPLALTDDYTARMAGYCVNALTPKWSARLGGFDTFVRNQCYAMEQGLRVD